MSKRIYDKMDEFNLSSEMSHAFKGWAIDKVGMTSHYYRDDPQATEKDRIEGGLTFLLSKGDLRRKVILGYTELGEWVENIEEIISEEFLTTSDRIIKENSKLLEDLAKGPSCGDSKCAVCGDDKYEPK